ncbi:MAG: hypothetical protein ACL7BU_10210 [Candidatus Phlomobacter fragariae]
MVSLGADFGLPLGHFDAGVGTNVKIMPLMTLYGEIYGSSRDFTSGNYSPIRKRISALNMKLLNH